MQIRKFGWLPVIVACLFLAGCGNDQPATNMDELSGDNKYHYQNEMLGFSVSLPASFEYYQTQRTDSERYKELEIFVPTNDTSQHEEVSGYANPVTVRVYPGSAWQQMRDAAQGEGFAKVKEAGSRVYAVKFWQETPSDWQDKWSKDTENDILGGFKVD